MTSVLSEETGAPVEYVDLPIDMWGQILSERAGLPTFLVNHLKHVAQDHKDGVFDVQTDTVERIGGKSPEALDAFIRRHRDSFASNEAVAS